MQIQIRFDQSVMTSELEQAAHEEYGVKMVLRSAKPDKKQVTVATYDLDGAESECEALVEFLREECELKVKIL